MIDLRINYKNTIEVAKATDFGESINGVITLKDYYTYEIKTEIDLEGKRIVCGINNTILGASSENCSLTSTGLGSSTALISSNYTTAMRHFTIKDVGTALDFDGKATTMALDWTGVNFENVPIVGTIDTPSNWIFSKGAFINSKGLLFTGNIGTIGVDNSLFIGDGSIGNIFEVNASSIITRRFRIIYSAFVVTSNTVGISVSTSATVPNEGFILDTVNFSGGGSYIDPVGVQYDDNKALFIRCRGVNNSAEIGQYYMNGNTTSTTITAVSTPTKISGITTASSVNQKFSHSNNRLVYSGAFTRFFKVTSTISVTSGNNNQVGVYISKNGSVLPESEVYGTTNGSGRAENIVVQTLVSLGTNDYIEIYVENATTKNNILATDLNTIID